MREQEPSRTDRGALRLAAFVTGRPWLVTALTVAVALAAASGARHLEFSNNYRVFFSQENPDLIAFETFQDTYTKNDNILFILQPAAGGIFDPRLADAVERLTAEAWKIPYAIRVDSVTNFQHSWADGDDLTVEDLIRDGRAMTAAELERRRGTALREPLLRGNLISADARTTGINVTLQYPEQNLTEVPEAVAFARTLAKQVEGEFPDVRVALSGVSMLNNAFAESGQQDAMTLMPLMFAVLVLFMVVVLRSVAGTVSTLLVIGMSTATALGLAGRLGIELTPISVTAPIVIMTLAIADSVHVLLSMMDLMREGRTKLSALAEALRINLVPVAITSVTTVVGFLSLNFSDAPPFRHLGSITAMGIAAALVYSLTFLPAVVSLLPVRVRKARTTGRRGLESALTSVADWVTGRHRSVLAVIGVLAVATIALVPMVELNDEFVKYFDHRVPFRGDAEFGMDHLNGIYMVEYSVEAAEAGGISSPAYLADLERFTSWLRAQPEVTHVYSYSDVIKRLNKNLHGDDGTWYRIPDDRQLAAQYLLLYELSLPYGLDLNDRVSVDKSATRVTASVGNLSTVKIRELIDRADRWLETHVAQSMRADATGASVMFSYISQRNINSMLSGNALALLLIAAIMVAALRSLPMGALSLIPNAVPILMTFGLWAVLVGQVGMASAMVTATSLGVVVDDTVHLLAKYLRARREKGYERPDAVRYAFRTAGKAVVSTTLILAFGFAVLALSTFKVNAEMGLLTALAILVALPIDFLLLPALLMIGHEARNEKEVSSHETVLVPAS